MAKKVFTQVSKIECDKAKADGKVGLCNLTSNKVEVDEEGHFIPPYGHAVVDKTNPMIASLVGRGILAINETATEEPKKAAKTAKVVEIEEKESVEIVPAEAIEPPSEVASDGDEV